MSQENHPIIALIQKINNSPIPLCHWILEKENPSLGIYMERLAKPLRDYSAFYAELCLPTDQIKACPFPKKLPASIRNAAKNVLDLLQDQLFQDTSLLSQEKSLFIETYRLSYQKQLDPYSFKQRSKARKSTHPIDEMRAVYVIEWLIEEILCTASLGAAFTLLYIWITLQAAFAGVRTSVDEILRLSAPSSISHNLQKLPVIKGGKIYFGKNEVPIPNGLLKIIDAAIDNRSEKPIFQGVRSTIENYLQKAHEALGVDNKEDPLALALETFLRRPIL